MFREVRELRESFGKLERQVAEIRLPALELLEKTARRLFDRDRQREKKADQQLSAQRKPRPWELRRQSGE